MLKYKKFFFAKSNETLLGMKRNKLYRSLIIDKFSFLLPLDLSWNDGKKLCRRFLFIFTIQLYS